MEGAKVDTGKEEHLFKIILVGDIGTGKTSFIKRGVHNLFSPQYKSTIGVDFALKVVNYDENTLVRMQLWDIAGQERFGNMTRVYYKEASGAFIFFDATRATTFEAVEKWINDIRTKVTLEDDVPIPIYLIAAKSDLYGQVPPAEPLLEKDKLDNYCKNHDLVGWFAVSSKDNVNIDQALDAMTTELLMATGKRPRPQGGKTGNTEEDAKMLSPALNSAFEELYDSSIQSELDGGTKYLLFTPLVKIRCPTLLDEKLRDTFTQLPSNTLGILVRFIHQGLCAFEDNDMTAVFQLLAQSAVIGSAELENECWHWIHTKLSKSPWEILAQAVAHNNQSVKERAFLYIAAKRSVVEGGSQIVKTSRQKVPECALDLAEFVDGSTPEEHKLHWHQVRTPFVPSLQKFAEDMAALLSSRNATGDCEIVFGMPGEDDEEQKTENEKENENENEEEDGLPILRTKAHRIVLASHNEYFKTALTTTIGHSMLRMSTARKPTFYLPPEFQLSMEALEALLRYLYTGIADIKTPTIAQQLKGVAEYLLISPKSDPARAVSHEKFLTTCHEVESGPLTADNSLDLLVSSWQLGHEELVEKALLFTAKERRTIARHHPQKFAELPSPLFQRLLVKKWSLSKYEHI